MPPRFEWYTADVWLPSALKRADDPRSYTAMRGFRARLRPGLTIREAEAQLAVVAARRATEHPNAYPPHARVVVVRLIDFVVRDFRSVVGLRLLGGRQMSAGDVQTGRHVALINETLARRYFGHTAEALGREIRLPALTDVADPRLP